MTVAYVRSEVKSKIAPSLCHVLWNKPAKPLCLTASLSPTIGCHNGWVACEKYSTTSFFLKFSKTRLRSVSFLQADPTQTWCFTPLFHRVKVWESGCGCNNAALVRKFVFRDWSSWMRKCEDWTVIQCLHHCRLSQLIMSPLYKRIFYIGSTSASYVMAIQHDVIVTVLIVRVKKVRVCFWLPIK